MSSRRPSIEKSRLRMDSYSSAGRSWRRSRPSPPRRRELDNVMKKARKEGPDKSSYWNKKLLEVEERDPNRWRHSGFKELYGEGSERKGSNSRSRSPRSRSRSRTRSRSRDRDRERDRDRSRERSLRPRSPPPRPKSPPARPMSPPRKAKARPRSPRSPRSPKSPRSRPKPTTSSTSRAKIVRKPRRTTPQPAKARSESLTSGSVSSCSDDSCSVCSPKTKRKAPAPPKEKERERTKVTESSPNNRPGFRSRSRSFSVPRSKPAAAVEKPRRKTKRKRDKDKTAKAARRRRPVVKVESESERSSSPSPGPRLTLSERFGKMAQWSVDRDMEHHRNLRITAGDQLTVEMDSPPSPPYPASLSSLPEGSWDDVRIRYTYYKERGYLRDLTLQDYVKWEEWWYKYQDWLEKERCYDRMNMYNRRR